MLPCKLAAKWQRLRLLVPFSIMMQVRSSAHVKSDVWNFFDKTGHKTAKQVVQQKLHLPWRDDQLTWPPEPRTQQRIQDEIETQSNSGCFYRPIKVPHQSCEANHQPNCQHGRARSSACHPCWETRLRGTLKYIEPGYKVPSATHITQVVHRKHKAGKRLLKQKLANSTLDKFGDYNRHLDKLRKRCLYFPNGPLHHQYLANGFMYSCKKPFPRPSHCCQHCW